MWHIIPLKIRTSSNLTEFITNIKSWIPKHWSRTLIHSKSTFIFSKVYVMTNKKSNCAELGLVNVFKFERDSVKPTFCIRRKAVIIIMPFENFMILILRNELI